MNFNVQEQERFDDLVAAAASLIEPGEEDLNPEYMRALEDLILRVMHISGEQRPDVQDRIRSLVV